MCKRGTWYLVGLNNEIVKTYKVTSIESAFGYGKDIKIIEPVCAIDELKKKALETINLYSLSC